MPVSPAQDVTIELKWARYGRLAFVLIAVCGIVALLVISPWAGHVLHKDFEDCQRSLDAGNTCSTFGSGGTWRFNLASLVGVLPQLLMLTWLFQVASVAQRLGLPARRSPGWAYGYFVPVVNLWFPYQVARDCLPPGHPSRSMVGWWWAFTLSASLVGIPVLVIAALGHVGVAVAAAVPLTLLPLAASVLGYRLVGRINESHLALLARYRQ